MEADGWVTVEVVEQEGRPDKRVHTPSPEGRRVLADWIAAPTPMEALRSEVAVKMRGASYGDRAPLIAPPPRPRGRSPTRLAHFEKLEREQFPDPGTLTGQRLDKWLVLRGGIQQEQFWVDWLTEYVGPRQGDHRMTHPTVPRTSSSR